MQVPIGVKAEADTLRTVLLYEPDEMIFHGSLFPSGFLYENVLSPKKANEEHSNFRKALEKYANVIVLNNVLKEKAEELNRKDLEALAFESLIYDLSAIRPNEHKEILKEKERVIQTLDNKDLIQIILYQPTINISYNEKNTKYRSTITYQPLTNIFFVRDQQITTERGIVQGKMNSKEREKETLIMELAFKALGIRPIYKVQGEGRLEGGDYIPLNGEALLGIGLRTNIDAAYQLLRNKVFGNKEIALVIDEYQQQDEMHLDTYLNIPAYKKAVVLEDRLNQSKYPNKVPRVIVFKKTATGYQKDISLTGRTLEQYLRKKGIEIIPTTKEEQLAYSINFLTLKNNMIIGINTMPKSYQNKLHKAGIKTTIIGMEHLIRTYGSLHCMTQALYRE